MNYRSIWLCLLLLSAAVTVRSADTLMLQPAGDAVLTMSPDSQLAPWALIAASGENSKISGATFEVQGLEPSLISGVILCSDLGEYSDELLHFPYNRKNQAAKLTAEGQTLRAEFTPPVAVPPVLSRKPGLLLGFALSDRAAGEFTITLKSVSFGPDQVELEDGARTVRIIPGVPEADIATTVVTAPTGVPAVRITVTPKQPLAFAPGITLQFTDLKINNFHRWGDLYRSLMTPLPDGRGYEFTWPEYALLSDNLLPPEEKKTSYQATPPPNNWKLRPDNTGFDLFDGDARGAQHASPGGLEFVGADKVTLVIDLRRDARIGAVSLYGLFGLSSITAGVAATADGPWSPAVSVNCPMSPQEQFGVAAPNLGVGLNPALFNLFFPELYPGRYVKLDITGSRHIGITEILIWGVDPARPAQFPDHAVISLTSMDGARARKSIPIRKTNQ